MKKKKRNIRDIIIPPQLRTADLSERRAIGHPTDLLGNEIESPKDRIKRWNYEIKYN
tara:strand:+ start:193 stop:363 length:171 start_codon:yes stop_codon:yes gene_type:complete